MRLNCPASFLFLVANLTGPLDKAFGQQACIHTDTFGNQCISAPTLGETVSYTAGSSGGTASAVAGAGYVSGFGCLTAVPPSFSGLQNMGQGNFGDYLTIWPSDPLLVGQNAQVSFSVGLTVMAFASVSIGSQCCSAGYWPQADAGAVAQMYVFDNGLTQRFAWRSSGYGCSFRQPQGGGAVVRFCEPTGFELNEVQNITVQLGSPFYLHIRAVGSGYASAAGVWPGHQGNRAMATGHAIASGARISNVRLPNGTPVSVESVQSTAGLNYVSSNGAGPNLTECAPAITMPPSPAAAVCGQTVTLSFTYSSTSATGPASVIWTRDGSPLPDGPTTWDSVIMGASTTTLTVANVHRSDAGLYVAYVFNSCGLAASVPAVLILCPADFNCSGAAAVDDIFSFLNAWFSNDPRADINAINGITVQDIFDFLAGWFAGC